MTKQKYKRTNGQSYLPHYQGVTRKKDKVTKIQRGKRTKARKNKKTKKTTMKKDLRTNGQNDM